MLSEEEKKAIEKFKKLKDYKQTFYGNTWFKVEVCADDEMKQNIDTILNLIDKQQKEIGDDLTTVYLNGVYDGEEKVEAKIKARIEKLEAIYNELSIYPKEHLHSKTEYLIVIGELQSLLKKE